MSETIKKSFSATPGGQPASAWDTLGGGMQGDQSPSGQPGQSVDAKANSTDRPVDDRYKFSVSVLEAMTPREENFTDIYPEEDIQRDVAQRENQDKREGAKDPSEHIDFRKLEHIFLHLLFINVRHYRKGHTARQELFLHKLQEFISADFLYG